MLKHLRAFSILSLTLFFFPVLGTDTASAQESRVVSEEERDDAFRERWREVYDQIFEDELLAQWAMDRFMRDIKHDLDARVDEIFFNHPFAKKFWPTILQQARMVSKIYVLKHLGGGSESLDSEDGDIINHPRAKELLRPVMERLPISRAARENARLFHIPSDTVNAYTWSGLRFSHMEMAFFEGLLSDLDDENVQGVQAHEIAHILGLHVPVSMGLQAVFFATGEILIPEGDHHMLDKHLEEIAPTALSNARGHLHTSASKSIPPAVKVIAAEVRALAAQHPEEAADFFKQLGGVMEFSEPAQSSIQAAWAGQINAEAQEAQPAGFDFKAYMEFMERMADRSRSCEATCDRIAAIVAGEEASVGAFLILQAGPDANPEAVAKGGDEVLRALAEDPSLRQYINDNGASHPNLTSRRRAIRSYVNSDSYRIHSDPFLFALTDYIAVSKLLIEHQHTNNERLGELADQARSEFVRDQYIVMARQLRDLLIEGVVEEFQAEKADMHRFAALYEAITVHLDAYDDFHDNGDVVNEFFVNELHSNERLLPMLIEALKKLPKNDKTEKAIELLEELMPEEENLWGIDGFLADFSQGAQSRDIGDIKSCASHMIEAGRPGRLARLSGL